jgi:hypothetical protein
VEYARDRDSGKVIAAEKASPLRYYVCPRPGCGGRVYLPKVTVQKPHFRHYPGEGTPACDEYFPGDGNGEEIVSLPVAAVEENPTELGLLLTQVDGRWGIGLRLPEIPSEELGEKSLADLMSAHVDIYEGAVTSLRVPSLDLRPGVGAARVEVGPTLQAYRTQPAGEWPGSIQRDRWRLEARGLEGKGVLFRLRVGEWTRLVAGSVVHLGETVLVLAERRCVPPGVTGHLQRLVGGGLEWRIWEVRLPAEPQERVTAWLAGLGHSLVPRPWCVDLVTPPRSYSEGGVPIFWVKDSPVLNLGAPQPAAAAMVEFKAGTNSYLHNVDFTQNRFAHVSVRRHDVGVTRLAVGGERGAHLDICFERAPSPSLLAEQLARIPRLRIRVGMQNLEAWTGADHQVPVLRHQQPEVHVDLCVDTVRARVTVWEGGRQRIRRGLDARGVERAIDDALSTASRIEVDADNLGRIVLLPMPTEVCTAKDHSPKTRLAWWDEAVRNASHRHPRIVETVVSRPGSGALSIRSVSAAALVRARLALRRHRVSGDISP